MINWLGSVEEKMDRGFAPLKFPSVLTTKSNKPQRCTSERNGRSLSEKTASKFFIKGGVGVRRSTRIRCCYRRKRISFNDHVSRDAKWQSVLIIADFYWQIERELRPSPPDPLTKTPTTACCPGVTKTSSRSKTISPRIRSNLELNRSKTWLQI